MGFISSIETLLGNTVQQLPINGSSLVGQATSVLSSFSGNNQTINSTDTRIRLGALNTDWITASPIMSILAQTNGMLFPYTPTITVNQGIDYQTIALVHSNTDYQAYTRTQSTKISVNGKFTVQNQREGQYALAAIHFLRSASKSYFGETDAKGNNAGLPPPVLVFSGYGNFMFNNLRVIMTSHTVTFDENIDTIPINVQTQPSLSAVLPALPTASSIAGIAGVGGIVRLPAMFNISVELVVIQTPTRMRTVFSFDDFASGRLMQAGGPTSPNTGWI